METKPYTPAGPKKLFLKRPNFKFCIIFKMISFTSAQCSVKIRLACSEVLLLIYYFERRL